MMIHSLRKTGIQNYFLPWYPCGKIFKKCRNIFHTLRDTNVWPLKVPIFLFQNNNFYAINTVENAQRIIKQDSKCVTILIHRIFEWAICFICCNVMSMWSSRWHFTNRSITVAPKVTVCHTAGHYGEEYNDWNSDVFRSQRNCSSDVSERTDGGTAFHARAAATGKDQPPSVVHHVDGMTSVDVEALQRCRREPTSAVKWQVSARYDGTVPLRQQYTRMHNRNWILSRTFIQCSSWRSGVMGSDFLAESIIHQQWTQIKA